MSVSPRAMAPPRRVNARIVTHSARAAVVSLTISEGTESWRDMRALRGLARLSTADRAAAGNRQSLPKVRRICP